jgi:endonuclease III related protein
MAASRALPLNVSPAARQSTSASHAIPSDFSLRSPSSQVSAAQCAASLAASAAVPALHKYFDTLFTAHGPQYWWPGRTRFEIIVGAILTQNTSWTNVERAIRNLRTARFLTPDAVLRARSTTLALLLRPSGYFRQKAKTLKSFVKFLFESYRGSLTRMFAMPTPVLRAKLLAVRGIGPETADSILLYAGKHSVFVVDAYTRRILERHGLSGPKAAYEEIRKTFEASLPADHQLFNEFHALIVHTGKHFCHKTNPVCEHCPLRSFLPPVAGHQSLVASS